MPASASRGPSGVGLTEARRAVCGRPFDGSLGTQLARRTGKAMVGEIERSKSLVLALECRGEMGSPHRDHSGSWPGSVPYPTTLRSRLLRGWSKIHCRWMVSSLQRHRHRYRIAPSLSASGAGPRTSLPQPASKGKMACHRRAATALWVVITFIGVGCQPDRPLHSRAPEASSPLVREPGPRCNHRKVPHKKPGVRAMAFPRGPGPAYVGLGTAGFVYYAQDTREHRGWYYNKILIGISPDYRLGMSVNGRRRDGREILRWHNGPFPGRSRLVLDVPADEEGTGWRYMAGDVLIRAPGCYVIRLEGRDFLEEVAFRAEPLPRSEIPCPSPNGAFDPRVTPEVGPAGSEATVSGPLPLYSKSSRYVGPSGKKIELWWNLEPSRYATAVSFWDSTPEPVAARNGPVLLVGATRLWGECTFRITFDIPEASPDVYPLVAIVYGGRGAASLPAMRFRVTAGP
jgi:hypothetical protein